jgi:hypothetical protein
MSKYESTVSASVGPAFLTGPWGGKSGRNILIGVITPELMKKVFVDINKKTPNITQHDTIATGYFVTTCKLMDVVQVCRG